MLLYPYRWCVSHWLVLYCRFLVHRTWWTSLLCIAVYTSTPYWWVCLVCDLFYFKFDLSDVFFFQNMISVLALTLTHITCTLFPKAPCAMCGSQRKYLVCFQNMFMKMWIFVNECIFLVCVWEVVKCVICVNVTVLWVFYITIQVWGQ